MFAYDPPSYEQQVRDVATARRFLVEEETKWFKAQQQFRVMIRKLDHATVPVETDEELERAVRPAIGFWLFPAEAMGGIDGDLSGSKKAFDMRGYWPELALSCVS